MTIWHANSDLNWSNFFVQMEVTLRQMELILMFGNLFTWTLLNRITKVQTNTNLLRSEYKQTRDHCCGVSQRSFSLISLRKLRFQWLFDSLCSICVALSSFLGLTKILAMHCYCLHFRMWNITNHHWILIS